MLISTLKKYLFLVLSFMSIMAYGQEPKTIKVRKESDLVKAFFDANDFKLIAIDRFGNPQDNKIMGFKLYVKTKRETKEFESFSATLTSEMLSCLNDLKLAAKIFFTNVMVEENDGKLTKLPDVIDVWFPNPNNNKSNKKRK